ncbi:MAG: hypothetical protein J5794_04905 [Lachnospiraceae bacterium]|nr:hypothetical protein [Lachnospiraceae bacterium]
MKEFVLSFDIGTSSVKAAAVSFDCELLASSLEPLRLYQPDPARNEQDPEELWEACCRAARLVMRTQNREALRGIVFGTYWKGIIPVDADGKILHRNLLWCDNRAGEEARFLNEHFGVQCFSGIDYWPKLLWLKTRLPEIYEKAAYLHEAGSYLKFRATGEAASDYDNNFIRTTEPLVQEAYDRIVDLCGLDRAKFAPLVMSTDRIGEVTPEAAEKLGVPSGVPVFGGTTDMASVATGAGCSIPGKGHLYMGTSGWIGAAVPTDPAYPFFLPYYPGMSLAISGIRSAGQSYAWVLNTYYRDVAPAERYRVAEEEVSRVPAGSRGLRFLPFRPETRPAGSAFSFGEFRNADASHTRADYANAVMEGIALQLRQGMKWVNVSGFAPYPQIGKILIPDPEALRNNTPPSFDVIRAVGGCARSDTWMQRTADILNTPIEVPESPQHAAAVGVAVCALIGLGVLRSFKDAAGRIRAVKCFEPSENRDENSYRNL